MNRISGQQSDDSHKQPARGGGAISRLKPNVGMRRRKKSVRQPPIEGQKLDADSGAGHRVAEIHFRDARANSFADHSSPEPQRTSVGNGADHTRCDSQQVTVSPDLINAIVEQTRRRRAFMLAKGDMERRIKSKERSAATYRHRLRGLPIKEGKFPEATADDKAVVKSVYAPFFEALAILTAPYKEAEKARLALVKKLPIMPWAESVRGFGMNSLGEIVGEAGDLSKYGGPAKLWKRMGLAVFDGKSQRKCADAAKAIEQGYNPNRRAVMHIIGENLIRAKNLEYRVVYDTAKTAKLALGWTKLHAHRHGLRVMEKKLLADLWKAWRG